MPHVRSTSQGHDVAPAGAGRLVWMDTMRGAAVLLVVLFHAIGMSQYDPPWALLATDHLVKPFRVPAMMFLSGMLLPQAMTKPRAVYLRGKVSRILWPYLLWSLLLAAVATFGRPGPDPLAELVVPTSPLWFVGYLFVYYVLVMLCPPAVRTCLLVPAAAGLLLTGPTLVPDLFAQERALSLPRFFFCFVCFLCGDLLARNGARWLPALTRPRVTVVCALLALPAMIASVAGLAVRYQSLFLVSTVAGIVAAIPLCGRLGETGVGRFVASVGRSSVVVYVTHWPAVLVAYHVALAIGLHTALSVTAFNLVAGLSVSLAMIRLRARVPAVDLLYDLHLERSAFRAASGPTGATGGRPRRWRRATT